MTKNIKKSYYIVEESALPEVILKTVQAKRLLDSGRAKTLQAAASEAGISRSAFYKYKDLVQPFYESMKSRTITLAMNLADTQGILSHILNIISEFKANVLTIYQNIPMNHVANATITIETGDQEIESLISEIEKLDGVITLKLIAKE